MTVLHNINKEQRLYTYKTGHGYSCYGFDVIYRKSVEFAKALKQPAPPVRKGTKKAWAYYQKLSKMAAELHKKTGIKFLFELTPQLIGLEGKRVEVVTTYDEKRRFWVGKSYGGWVPIHLEVARSTSSGGVAAEREYKSVTVIR